MKTLVQCSQYSDSTVIEYDDGSITVMWHLHKPNNEINGFNPIDYPTKADYEIAKLERETKAGF